MVYEEFISGIEEIIKKPQMMADFIEKAESGDPISAFLLSYVYLYLNDTENAIRMADLVASDHAPHRVNHAIFVHMAVKHIFPIHFNR